MMGPSKGNEVQSWDVRAWRHEAPQLSSPIPILLYNQRRYSTDGDKIAWAQKIKDEMVFFGGNCKISKGLALFNNLLDIPKKDCVLNSPNLRKVPGSSVPVNTN